MTLDEAIKHCEEVAEENEKFCFKKGRKGGYFNEDTDWDEKKCAKEHRQLAKWLRDYKRLLDQTMWIHVSEKLPNRDEYIRNNGLFIVSDGNRSYSEWFDIYDTQKFGEPTMSGFRVDYAVTHWMPLPELYKAESEENNG